MSTVKEKPTFKIVENHLADIDYDEFKKDFLDPYMTAKEVKDKHDMTKGQWNEYRLRVLEEEHIDRKPSYTWGKMHYMWKTPKSCEYIQKTHNGYVIAKKWGSGEKSRSSFYGRYKDYDTAKYVRDKLVEADWDYTLAVMLMDKYAVSKRFVRAMDKAEAIYEDFKYDYFHSPDYIKDVCKKYHIGDRVYQILLRMIRGETGVTHRPVKSKRCQE